MRTLTENVLHMDKNKNKVKKPTVINETVNLEIHFWYVKET